MKKMINLNSLSLGSKLIIFQAAAIIIVLLILAIVSGQIIRTRVTENNLHEMSEINKRIIEMIDVYNIKLMQETKSLSAVLVNNADSGNGNNYLTQEQIDNFTSVTGAVATLFVRQGDDFLRVSTSLRKQDGTRASGTILDRNHPGYGKVLNGENYTGPAILFGRNYMTHYEPVKNNNTVTGIYFIGIDFTEGIKNLKEKIRAVKIADNGYLFVLSGDKNNEAGKCVVHISPEMEEKNLIALKDNNGLEFIKTIIQTKNGILKYNWNDEGKNRSDTTKYAAYTYYDKWDWVIASSARENDLVRDGVVLKNYLFAGFFLCSVVILLVLYFAIKKIITMRFRRLNDVVKDLSRGKGDLTVRLELNGNDEIGELTANFNFFINGLEKMIKKIKSAGENLVQAVEGISEGNQNLSHRTTSQSASLEEIVSTIEETVSSLGIIADNSEKAKEISAENADNASSGNSIAIEAVEAINNINICGKKIMNTLGIIHEIAFQTNLLALNASVEAARAGENGRGFAIVAEEVRNLAQRAAVSAKEIEKVIKESLSEIEKGTELVVKTGKVLEEISGAAKHSAGVIAEISTATSEQKHGISQINDAVGMLDSMTQQNAALVEETAAAASEMTTRGYELVNMLRSFKVS